MIFVRRAHKRISIRGHAASDERVCAAVSTLTVGLYDFACVNGLDCPAPDDGTFDADLSNFPPAVVGFVDSCLDALERLHGDIRVVRDAD